MIMHDKELINSKSLLDESDCNLSFISPIKVFITQKKKNHKNNFRIRRIKRFASISNCMKGEHTEKILSKNQNEHKYDVVNVEKKKRLVEVKKKPEHIEIFFKSENNTPSRADSKCSIHTPDLKKIRFSPISKAKADAKHFLKSNQAYPPKFKQKTPQKNSFENFFSKDNLIIPHTLESSVNKIPKQNMYSKYAYFFHQQIDF